VYNLKLCYNAFTLKCRYVYGVIWSIALQHLATTDQTPSTLQDWQKLGVLMSYWRVIGN
jgi:hypothetical protein